MKTSVFSQTSAPSTQSRLSIYEPIANLHSWSTHDARARIAGEMLAKSAHSEVVSLPIRINAGFQTKLTSVLKATDTSGGYWTILKALRSGTNNFKTLWRKLAPFTDEAVGTALVESIVKGAFGFFSKNTRNSAHYNDATSFLACHLAVWSKFRLPTKAVGFNDGETMQHATQLNTKKKKTVPRGLWQQDPKNRNGHLHYVLDTVRREKALAKIEEGLNSSRSVEDIADGSALVAGVFTVEVIAAPTTALNQMIARLNSIKQAHKAAIYRENFKSSLHKMGAKQRKKAQAYDAPFQASGDLGKVSPPRLGFGPYTTNDLFR